MKLNAVLNIALSASSLAEFKQVRDLVVGAADGLRNGGELDAI